MLCNAHSLAFGDEATHKPAGRSLEFLQRRLFYFRKLKKENDAILERTQEGV